MANQLPNTQLRKQLFTDQAQGEAARDTQQAFDVLPRMITVVMEGYYSEPMPIGSPLRDQKPESISLAQLINIATPEQPNSCSEHVDWLWKPQNGGAVVTGIDGLTPSTSKRYRFFFRFFYSARAGVVNNG